MAKIVPHFGSLEMTDDKIMEHGIWNNKKCQNNVKLKTIHRFLSLEFETWNLFVI